MTAVRKIMPWTARPLALAARDAKHKAVLDLTGDSILLGRSAILAGWTIGAVGVACLVAVIAIFLINPPVRTIEWRVETVDRTTGIIDEPVSIKNAPKTFSDATNRHYLWQFLRARESWVAADDSTNDHIVKIMSSPEEQAQYQAWRALPTSPMNTLKATGRISIDNLHYYPRPSDGDTLHYLVTFERTIWQDATKDSSQIWSADISFQWHPDAVMLPDDRQYNAGGMVVVDYSTNAGMADQGKR
jgi:type IV secretion system protein VirB8